MIKWPKGCRGLRRPRLKPYVRSPYGGQPGILVFDTIPALNAKSKLLPGSGVLRCSSGLFYTRFRLALGRKAASRMGV